MTTYPVSSANSAQNAQDTQAAAPKVLNQEDFLKLISVQMSAQDPMNPMKDTDFIAQMANFTSLEQMKTLSASFSTYIAQSRASDAQNYIGKTVSVLTSNGTVSGEVSGVKFEDGEPRIIVGGNSYDPQMVTSITATPQTGSSTAATH